MSFMIILTNKILWRSQKVGIKFGIMKKFQLINAWPTPEVFSLRMTIQSSDNLGLRMSVTLNKPKVLENIWFYFPCACSPLEWKVMNYDKRFWNMSNKPIKTQQMLYTILRQLYWYFLTCLFCRIITTGFSKFLDVLRLVDREMTPEAKVAWWSNLTLSPLFWVAACLNKCDYTFLIKVLTNQKMCHWYFILIINHHL